MNYKGIIYWKFNNYVGHGSPINFYNDIKRKTYSPKVLEYFIIVSLRVREIYNQGD